MSFNVHTKESAPETSRPLLENIEKMYGFIPNLSGVMAESPLALEAYQTLSGLVKKKAGLSAVEQQVVMLAVSFDNGCDYCMAAHTVLAGMDDVPEDVIETLRAGNEPADAKLAALVRFAKAVVADRGWISEDTQQDFLDNGYEPAHILDVITIVAMKTISNYTNHVAETPLDSAFEEHQWSKPE